MAEDRRVALITAASRGMGAACARELAGRGYAVALMARSPEIEEFGQELGGIGLVGSVTSDDNLATLVQKGLDAFGRIDAVINNTGHPPKGELLTLSDDDWHAGLDLLLLNVVRMARHVVPVMERQGGGAVVNISTFGAVEPSLSFPISSALRSALGGFVKLFSDRYAGAGIRMNNLLPGFVDSYDVDEETRGRIPVGRPATTTEIAETAAFLVSDEARYITGQSLRVDGGLTRSI